jgi:hypothetical protein
MTREATERCLAKRSAHAMRAAAIRLALDRAGQDADPAEACGCVDWFRYEASSSPQKEDTASLPAAAPGRDARRDGPSSAH